MQLKTQRMYYIDWLRVMAMLAIFLFHSDRFFDVYDWHVKNPQTNLFSTIHISYFSLWIMPLFFVLSGASIYYALQKRTSGQFIWERVMRILIPFLILGYLVTSPPQSYLDQMTNNHFIGSFTDFLPHYIEGFDSFGGVFPWHGFHLWYLLYLFVLSLTLIPFFRISKKTGRSLLQRFSGFFENRWSLILLTIPIIAANIFVDVMGMDFIRATGGWSIFSYIFFLMMGYLIFSNHKVLRTIITNCRSMLIIALGLAVFLMVVHFGIKPQISEKTPILYLVFTTTKVACSLATIFSLIGIFEKYLNFRTRTLDYANEADLPFYILHQLFLLLVGYVVVQWSINAMWKYIIIAVVTFSLIMMVYEFLIRRIPILRFLFGMKSGKVPKAA